jgi:hypothetical protein
MAEAGKGTAAPSPAGKAPTAYFSGPRKAGTGQMPTEETSTNK